jgi:hypothetical protein
LNCRNVAAVFMHKNPQRYWIGAEGGARTRGNEVGEFIAPPENRVPRSRKRAPQRVHDLWALNHLRVGHALAPKSSARRFDACRDETIEPSVPRDHRKS